MTATQYPFPLQDATLVTEMGLIPLEIDIESRFDDHDREIRKSNTETAAAPNIQVYNRYPLTYDKTNELTSAGVPRIERHSRHFAKKGRSTLRISRRSYSDSMQSILT
jgi:hypothetical protein